MMTSLTVELLAHQAKDFAQCESRHRGAAAGAAPLDGQSK